MDVKGRDLGLDVAEAVLDLPGLDELAKIDRDRYRMVGNRPESGRSNDCGSDCLCDRLS